MMKIRTSIITHTIKRAVVVAIAATFGVHTLTAQTDAQYTQYYEAANLYNPASVGNTDNVRLRGGVRAQWVGIDNAPMSILGTGDMPFKFLGKRWGVGAVVQSESYGLYNSLVLGAQLAGKFRKFGGELSVGLNVGMYDQRFRGSEVYIPDDDDYHQSTDDAIPQRDIHGSALDLGVGVWYTRRNIWAGLSCTHITSPQITMKSENEGTTEQSVEYQFQADRTLYLMGGCNIPLKNTLFELMPSALVKSDFNFISGEATLRARYNKLLTFGLGYRWNDAVYATVALEYRDFFVGYAYDYSTSAIAKATSGSHEVFLGYSMKLDLSEKNKNRHKSIRIM